MLIPELDQAIRDAGRTGAYDIRTVATPESQPSDTTVLEPVAGEPGRWVVYYSERGQITDPRYFDTEEQACAFVHDRLTATPNKRYTLTPAEQARAAELAAETERERRAMLRDAGYDPDTGERIS